jgi:retinol dehydrogenase-12
VGLGKQSILELSKHNPKIIYLAARSKDKALAAIADLQSAVPQAKIEYLHCDLTDLESVAATAKEFISKSTRLDILMLNAGIMMVPPALTKDGYEIQFGTNHVGHALLTKLLLPTLLKTAEQPGADVRVVAVSSFGHFFSPSKGLIFDQLKTPMGSYTTSARYGQSKLSNILFMSELGRRYPSLTTAAVHPGVVDTELYRTVFGGVMTPINKIKKYFYTSVVDGAKNQLWAATWKKGDARGEVKSGEYYTPVAVTGQGTALATDADLAGRLWEWTEKELDAYKA